MHLVQINRLAATVPTALDARQRGRLHAYVESARLCERRIQELRDQLEDALKETEGTVGGEDGPAESKASAVLDLACRLEALEGVQPRVDGWLKQYVAALVAQATPEMSSEAEAYGDAGPM